MKLKKLAQLITIGILVTFITILQPLITLALTSDQIGRIATQVTVLITGNGSGSGVIIRKNGNIYTVLTNFHVLDDSSNYQVTTHDKKKYQVTNIKRIQDLDLATFEFKSTRKYKVVEQGNSKQITIGTSVYISGFPADKGLNFLENKISRIDEPQEGGYALVYRVGAFPGMSGGPILNSDGKLVGIHGKTRSVSVGLYQNTAEEYGIPLQTYLSALSISRSSQNQQLPRRSHTSRRKQSTTQDKYGRLENLLKAQDFKEADLETNRVIVEVANREREGYLRE